MLKLVDVGKGEQIALFNNIGIETISKCFRKCNFCPVSTFNRYKQEMSWETIKHIVQQLKELKYGGRIETYVYDDLFVDNRWEEILALIREELPRACIMTSTSGDSFKTISDLQRAFDLGLNQLQINVYSVHDASKDPAQFEKGIQQAKTREAELLRWVNALELDQSLSLYQNIGSKKKACQVIAKYGIKPTTTDSELEGPNHIQNRSGNIPDFRPALKEPISKHCTKPFRFLNINWLGNAILCCNDFYGETHFGNVMEKSLVEIWNDTNLHIYRLKLQNKKRDCFLCDKCDFNGGFYPHMTDQVTFGKETDESILRMDLRKRNAIFDTDAPVGWEQQGVPRK